MPLGPFADRRQVRAKPVGDNVVGIADEDRPVADSRVSGDLLDHLRVVISRQVSFPLAAVGHRQPADEVGQPDIGRPLLLGVLVQVVIHLPGLIPDPEVIVLLTDDVVEDHEVRQQDLVHPAPALKAVQVMFCGLAL